MAQGLLFVGADVGGNDGVARIWGAGEDFAPRSDNHGVSVGFASAGVFSALRGSDDMGEIFNGAGAEQKFPVRGAGFAGECGGRENHIGILHGAIEFGESEVVADGESEFAERGLRRDNVFGGGRAGDDAAGFVVLSAGSGELEEVDFVVSGDLFSVRREEDAGGVDAIFFAGGLGAQGDGSAEDEHFVQFGGFGEEVLGGAVSGGFGDGEFGGFVGGEQGEEFGERGDLRAEFGGAGEEILGAGEIVGEIVAGLHLNASGAERNHSRILPFGAGQSKIRKMTSRKILLPALPLAFVVIVLGAFTRLSDAGLGCPDWPACYGQLIGVPDSQTAQIRHPESPLDPKKAWIEVIHRYAAAILGLVVLAALVVAFRKREKKRSAILALALLVLAQAILGALTVTQKLQPAIVVSHLLGGMCIFFLIAFIVAPSLSFSSSAAAKTYNLRVWGIIAVFALAVQIALGGWVSANYAGLACGPAFPQCQNAFVPPNFTLSGFAAARQNPQLNPLPQNQLASIHFIHRAFALIVLLVIVVFAVKIWKCGKPRAAQFLLAFLALQILLGISAAAFNLPFWAALGHNAGAALLVAQLAITLSPTHPAS